MDHKYSLHTRDVPPETQTLDLSGKNIVPFWLASLFILFCGAWLLMHPLFSTHTSSGAWASAPVTVEDSSVPTPLLRAQAEMPTTFSPLAWIMNTTTSASAAASSVTTIAVKHGDTLARIFSRLKLDPKIVKALLTLKYAKTALKHLQAQKSLEITVDGQHRFAKLSYPLSVTNTLEITPYKHTFREKLIHFTPETHLKFSGGVIHSSLHRTAQAKGLDQKVLLQLTHIFRDELNFSHDIHSGDRFNILYNEEYLHNQKIGIGDIEAAEIVVHGNPYRAVRYVDAAGHADYYTPEGMSVHKGFIRYPVHFSHISSRYSLHRLNPITHRVRPHMAVDFAAPSGTPIKAAADGKVAFVGRKSGYGKAIMIHHYANTVTLYAHMRNFVSHLHAGAFVKEGQTIGYVGATGRSTGPHLHYELWQNGVKRNPLTVKLPSAAPLNKAARAKFIPRARRLVNAMAMNAGGQVNRNVKFAKQESSDTSL